MPINEFPYTNLHDLNIDWILKIVKDFQDKYENFDETYQEMLHNIEIAGENAVAALEEDKDTALAAINAFLEQCVSALDTATTGHVSELQNITNNQLDAINAAGQNQRDLLAQDGGNYVEQMEALLNQVPTDYRDALNQLQIINSILNENYNYPQIVQGAYPQDSPPTYISSMNTAICTQAIAGCAGRTLEINIASGTGVIRQVVYWTGWASPWGGHWESVGTSLAPLTNLTYTFPNDATYFSIIFAHDWAFSDNISPSDISVELIWHAPLTDKIVDLKNALMPVIAIGDPITAQAGKKMSGLSVGQQYSLTDDAGAQYAVMDVSAYMGGTITVKTKTIFNYNSRQTAFCNSSGVIQKIWTEADLARLYFPSTPDADGYYIATFTVEYPLFVFTYKLKDTGGNDVEITLTPNAVHVYTKTETTNAITNIVNNAISNAKTELRNATCYVSTNGNDNTGNGTIATPFATVNKALEMGYTNILLRGGVYRQHIDLTKTTAQYIIMSQVDWTTKVIFEPNNPVLCTSAPLVSGMIKTRSATITPTLVTGNDWIYQDGIIDITTLIDETERMPQERGYSYRCTDTKIVRCTASNVQDAIEEIENSNDYRWYQDETTLYFSCPEVPSTTHPICYSDGTALFTGNSRKTSVKCVGIETHYMSFNINQLLAAELIDCKASNVYAQGAFVYDRCLGATFRRCEAMRCIYNGNTGDGFNAHSYTSGDFTSHQTSALLIDCWSHDNCDDGFSDHERCESTIIGGLFEYNGKAGITPSYGSSNTCINVFSRHNINGFAYVGEATSAEGGKYGQMILYGCVAEENTAPSSDINDNCGYRVKANGNKAILINCKSIYNTYGYGTDNVSTMILIDCGSVGDNLTKYGSITTKNTTIVN